MSTLRHMAATVVLAGCVAAGAAVPAAAEAVRPGRADANEGRFVALGGEFGELRFACASCHGFDGQGNASGAFPRLAGQSGWYLYTALRDFASGARPSKVMGPIAAELRPDQMLDVAAWYAGQEAVPFPPNLDPAGPLVREGRRYASGEDAAAPACATCHGPQGIGRAPLYPFIAGQYQPYLAHQLRQFRAGRRGGDPMGVMHQVAAGLTDREIHALSVYFASLAPDEVTPADQSFGRGRARPPRPLPMMTGAVIDPEPERNRVVLPSPE